jgi:glycosyltransferase involved in cell wall biosynthesis
MFDVSFAPQLRRELGRVDPEQVALLVSSEFEGIYRNGGIGTFYKALSEQLADDGWYVILLLTYTDRVFGGRSTLSSINHIFSTSETERVLSLRAIHKQLLEQHAPDGYARESFRCLLFTQAVLERYPQARVYAEFPEMFGAAHHVIHAKHAGLLGDRCVVAVTMHSGHEWVFEANEKYVPDRPTDFWQVSSNEAFSFEQADLSFFPSHFLRAKVEAYGWRAPRAIHMPYFVPVFDRDRSDRNDLPQLDEARRPVVFFGRLEERKGLCTFVEALKALPRSLKQSLDVVFVGKVVPLFSADLRHLDGAQYVERELTGDLHYRVISDLYSADALRYVSNIRDPVVCLTSPEENFPNSALELGQLSLKLVVSDTGGFREALGLVERAWDVHWFEPKNVTALADAISEAIRDPGPSASGTTEAKVRQINSELRARRLARVREAFGRAAGSLGELAGVSIGVVWRGGEHLIDCLRSVETQTHRAVDVVVLDWTFGEHRGEDILERARHLFPKFQFMKSNSGARSPGAAWNHLVDATAKSAYVMILDSDSRLLPFAIEELVVASGRSGAAIISFPRCHAAGNGKAAASIASSVPGLLASDLDDSIGHLVRTSFLREHRYLEDIDAVTYGWEVVAAALATGALWVHYPYPLWETDHARRLPDESARVKRSYKVRQYLTQIPTERWSPRQLHMLLTATQQLQLSEDARFLPDVLIRRIASRIRARELAECLPVRTLVKAMAIKGARRRGLHWTYRFRGLVNRVLGS